MEDKQLFQPLLAPTTTTTTSTSATAADVVEHDVDDDDSLKTLLLSSNTSVVSRLLSVIFIGAISIWANIEASKGFEVTIINEAKDSSAGKRFDLFYISNDKATRMLLNTSSFVENLLYPSNNMNLTKKKVHHVILWLTSGSSSTNTTQRFTVDTSKSPEFVINISSSIMGDNANAKANVNYAIISALQRGMARIWLWDGDGECRAPPSLLDGFVEYISMLAGFGEVKNFVGGALPEFGHTCWDNKDPRVTAGFLDFVEGRNKGFIQRLNQGMRQRWGNRTVEDALGMEVKYLCDSYKKKFS